MNDKSVIRCASRSSVPLSGADASMVHRDALCRIYWVSMTSLANRLVISTLLLLVAMPSSRFLAVEASPVDSFDWVYTGPAPDAWVVSIAIDPTAPSRIYLGDWSGRKFRSLDSGQHWAGFEIDDYGGRVADFAIDPLAPSIVYAAISTGFDSGVYKSGDHGETWDDASGGLNIVGTNALAIDPHSSSTLYVGDSSQARIFRSDDAAISWTPVGFPDVTRQVAFLVINPLATSTLYAGTWGAGVFRTTDGGGQWSEMNNGLDFLYIEDFVINPVEPQTLYVSSGPIAPPIADLFKTTDGASTWTVIRTGFITSLALDPRDPETIYVGRIRFDGGGVVVSRDGGETWSDFGAGLEEVSVSALAIEPVSPWRIFAGTTQGLYVSMAVPLFEDGFESGDTSRWSSVVRGPEPGRDPAPD